MTHNKALSLLFLMFLLVFTATSAHSATVVTQGCGSVGASANNQPGPPFPPIAPSISATLSGCPAFVIPVGNTLSDVTLSFQNDWQLGATGVDTLVFSYAITGFNIPGMVATVSGSGLTGSMPPAGAIPLACTVVGEIVTCDDPVSLTGTFNGIGITVNAIWAMGGLDFAGSEGTTIGETLTYDLTPGGKSGTPEPTTILLVGVGLVVVSLATRRKAEKG